MIIRYYYFSIPYSPDYPSASWFNSSNGKLPNWFRFFHFPCKSIIFFWIIIEHFVQSLQMKSLLHSIRPFHRDASSHWNDSLLSVRNGSWFVRATPRRHTQLPMWVSPMIQRDSHQQSHHMCERLCHIQQNSELKTITEHNNSKCITIISFSVNKYCVFIIN